MSQLHPNGKIVSAHGGTLDYVDQDGQLLFSVAVPAGVRLAREYLDLAPDGVSVEVAEGDLVAIAPRSWSSIQPAQTEVESGANPDFQPTSADRLQRQMRHTMAQMQSETRSLNARIERLAAIERIPTAPVVEPVVIEPLAVEPAPSETAPADVDAKPVK
jgi:hypothetical protein